MAIYRKAILAALVAAGPLAGCATYDYGYGYDDYDRYGYYGGPAYYDPYYYGPTIGLGLGYTFHDRDGRRHHHRDRDGRDWRGDRDGRRDGNGDRDDRRDWRGDRDGQREGRDRSDRTNDYFPDG